MEKLEYLLTDEFISFSQKIAKIVSQKKAKKVELKAFYEKIQASLDDLDKAALAAEIEFERFKTGKGTVTPPVDDPVEPTEPVQEDVKPEEAAVTNENK